MLISNLPCLVGLASVYCEVWDSSVLEMFMNMVAMKSMLGGEKLQKENSLEIGFWCAAVVPIKLLLNENMVRVIKHLCFMFLSFWVQCGYQSLPKWGVGAADFFEYCVYLLEFKCGNNLLRNVTFPSGELHILIRPGGSEVFYWLPDDTSWLEKEIGKNVKTV